MSNRSFIYQHRKVLSTVERKVDVMACKIGDELNITSSKVTLMNGDLSECSHTSIELPLDDAIRLRDYLNKVYPLERYNAYKKPCLS